MTYPKSIISLAAASLVLASTAATASPVAGTRGASPAGKSDKLVGAGNLGLLLGIIFLAGVIAVIAGADNNHPASP